jgi:hypothetical protein
LRSNLAGDGLLNDVIVVIVLLFYLCYIPIFTFLRWCLPDVQLRDGGYDQKVNETVSVVANKTAELGSRTWGIMRGVMALASQKVEELAKEGGSSGWGDDWQRTDQNSEPYQKFEHDTNGKG